MTDAGLVVLCCIVLLALYASTQMIIFYRVQHAALAIVRRLARQGAYDSASAIDLSLPRGRSYRDDIAQKAVDILTRHGVVRRTGSGRFYLTM